MLFCGQIVDLWAGNVVHVPHVTRSHKSFHLGPFSVCPFVQLCNLFKIWVMSTMRTQWSYCIDHIRARFVKWLGQLSVLWAVMWFGHVFLNASFQLMCVMCQHGVEKNLNHTGYGILSSSRRYDTVWWFSKGVTHVLGCVWKFVSNFVSPKTALGNSHLEVQKTQNTFKKARQPVLPWFFSLMKPELNLLV